MVAMRITKGYFGDVDLAGVKWGGAVEFDVTDGHSSMALVHHGSDVDTATYEPTVVERAFE
jgi:hypothetical protein